MSTLPSDARVVILGAGHSGAQLAVDLRAKGHAGEILLLSAEDAPPYQRPPLSKAYLSGAADAPPPLLRALPAYEKAGVSLRLGVRATAIDRRARRVETATGERLAYDRLALATGARAAPAPFVPADLATPAAGLFTLRSLADARALIPALAGARRLAIAGGGLIGLEIAAHAAAAGIATTLVEAGPRLMARSVSPAVSDFFLARHRAAGVAVRLDARIEAVERADGRIAAVRLGDGETIACDLLVSAIGAQPRTELAEAAGLALDRRAGGVAVDAKLATEDPAIHALGDCAAFPSPWARDQMRVRLESVQNAVDQARFLAAGLATHSSGAQDAPAAYDALPWFWSDQGADKLQIAGLSLGVDRWVARGDPGSGRFSLLGFAGESLACVEAVNRPRDFMDARKLLAAGQSPPAAALADPEVRLAA